MVSVTHSIIAGWMGGGGEEDGLIPCINLSVGPGSRDGLITINDRGMNGDGPLGRPNTKQQPFSS